MLTQRRPLLFFGAQGLLLLLGALFTLLLATHTPKTDDAMAVALLLLAVVLLILTPIAWTVGLILHAVRGELAELHRSLREAQMHSTGEANVPTAAPVTPPPAPAPVR